MGWKASTIIVHKPGFISHEELLKELGYNHLSKIEEEPFEVAMNPDDNKVFVGTYKDNLLICAPDIPMLFFNDNQTETEKIFIKLFPTSEICSIVLHSVVNLWGYSVIKNGERIRARAGSSDDGTFLETGAPLEEEKELLSKSRIDENGNRAYYLDDFPAEALSEDQVGENFVFAISKRYFGEELHRADDLLFETKMTGYSFQATSGSEVQQSGTKSRKWWPYLLIFILLLIWQVLSQALK